MDRTVELQLSVQDGQASDAELQAILRTLAAELASQSAEVTPVSPVAMGSMSL